VRFEVLTAVKMSMLVFWAARPRGLVDKCHALDEHGTSIFRADDRGSMFLRNVGIYQQVHTAYNPGNQYRYLNGGFMVKTTSIWQTEVTPLKETCVRFLGSLQISRQFPDKKAEN
jgi:hypothetical protein